MPIDMAVPLSGKEDNSLATVSPCLLGIQESRSNVFFLKEY